MTNCMILCQIKICHSTFFVQHSIGFDKSSKIKIIKDKRKRKDLYLKENSDFHLK